MISEFLIFLSKGVPAESDGETLISRRLGLSFESIIISKPKHLQSHHSIARENEWRNHAKLGLILADDCITY